MKYDHLHRQLLLYPLLLVGIRNGLIADVEIDVPGVLITFADVSSHARLPFLFHAYVSIPSVVPLGIHHAFPVRQSASTTLLAYVAGLPGK